MTKQAKQRTTVTCPCGTKLKVSTDAAGKKVRCPKCGETFAIPSTLDKSPNAATTLATPEKRNPNLQTHLACPQCEEKLIADAVLCINCGFDLRTGKLRKATINEDDEDYQLRRERHAYRLGVALTVFGAGVTGALWYWVECASEMEVGYLVWLIGFAAGGGMWLGYRQQNLRAGLTAAGVTFAVVSILTGAMYARAIHRFKEGIELSPLIEKRILANYYAAHVIWSDPFGDLASANSWQISAAETANFLIISPMNEEVVREWIEVTHAMPPYVPPDLEIDIRIFELAKWRISKRIIQEDLPPLGTNLWSIFQEEVMDSTILTPQQIKDQIVEWEDWDTRGKFEDPAFVDQYLLHLIAYREYRSDQPDLTLGARTGETFRIPKHRWQTKLENAKPERDSISSDLRPSTAKRLERDAREDWGELVKAHLHRTRGEIIGKQSLNCFFEKEMSGFDFPFWFIATASALLVAGGRLEN